jgi:hypothetical protein
MNTNRLTLFSFSSTSCRLRDPSIEKEASRKLQITVYIWPSFSRNTVTSAFTRSQYIVVKLLISGGDDHFQRRWPYADQPGERPLQ